MAKKKRKSVSDSRLMSLWRKAVLKHWNYTDPLSGHRDPSGESLQCHHIVGRRRFLTRFDYRNGIPLTVESHQTAHTGHGAAQVRKVIGEDTCEYLDDLERTTAKDYFVANGTNEDEYRLKMKAELEEIIND